MPTNAAYTGTFDPITLGHQEQIERAAALFNQVFVAVATSSSKGPWFSLEQRIALAEQSLSHLPNVKVVGFTGLTVDFARQHQISALVRGVRSVIDFEYEAQLAAMNRKLAPEVDTVYLQAADHLRCVSSSLVKDVLKHGGDITPFVSAPVLAAMRHYLQSPQTA